MKRKVKLGIVVALVGLLVTGVTVRAGTPLASGEAGPADSDIWRTGTPDYDSVLESYTEVAALVLEHLRWPGGPRSDGYYWLPVEEDERDTVQDVIEEIRQIMGEDFPIAVSVVSIRQRTIEDVLAEALEKGAIDQEGLEELLSGIDGIEYGKFDIHSTGSPDRDLVEQFNRGFDVRDLKYWGTVIAATGVRHDGYYWVLVRDENWDAIHHTASELQQMMGEGFPVAFEVGDYRPGGFR